ncbi:MAG: protein sorting system archaetidylserine decarboxylase [Natronomonas sp.]
MFPALPALAPGTWRYARVPLLLAIPAIVIAPAFAGVFLVAAAAVLWFHRDPTRSPPPSGFVAPADGRVSAIRAEGGRIRISVFMNVTDVHVNRAPAPATVESVEHVPGGHLPAFSKDSDRNERVHLACGEYDVTLIAGAVARRIHLYVSPGDELDRGDRIGHISFGSRVDVRLPPEIDRVDVRVSEGQMVRAGETVVAVR